MTRHSIHIGIDNYGDNAITNLRFCTADARLLASFFQNVAGYSSVTFISDPTRGSILYAVMGVIAQFNPGDLLVLTYSGHGFRTEDKFLLSAADSRMQFIQEGVDGVPLTMLMEIVREKGCNCAFFVDACSDVGMGARGISVCEPTSESPERDLIPSATDTEGPYCGVMSPEVPLEIFTLGHGLFTVALDRALREAYEQGSPTMEGIHARVMAHANAICQANGLQCPQIVVSCSGRPVKLW